MRRVASVTTLSSACALAALATALAVGPTAIAQDAFAVPDWAYPMSPPAAGPPPLPDDRIPLRIPGSDVAFTRAQVKDLFAAPDWHPGTHPPMPEVVARGRKPSVYACGYCHLPDGTGRPENAPLAGLPAEYIVAQVAAFRSGERRSQSSGAYLPAEFMRTAAEQASAADVLEAAEYFSGLRMSRQVRIIETDHVPVTHVHNWLFVPTVEGGTEPLGARIVEVPMDPERHELRDSKSGFIAYVPTGSVARGERLAVGGGEGLTLPCAACHGADLRGVGLVPPIAGRSPTYLLRQLVAFRTGARSAEPGLPMQPVVARLGIEDMIDLAAYVAAQEP